MRIPVLFMDVCIVLGGVMIVAGAVYAALAARAVRKKLAAVAANELFSQLPEFEAHAARLQADVEAIDGLLQRARAAIDSINTGLRELKIPEAVAAIKATSGALRALLHP